MEELDIEGLFWMPAESDQGIAGRLTFNETDGAILNLVEPFSVPVAAGGRVARIPLSLNKEPLRIVGSAGGRWLTLHDCQESSRNMDSTGMVRRRYRVSVILSGAHFDDDEPLLFNSVTVGIGHLREWVGRSGLNVDSASEGDSNLINNVQISYTPIKPDVTNASWGELALTFPWTLRGDRFFESAIEHDCSVELRFTAPHTLENIFTFTSSLWHLVTIGIDSPTSILSMTLSHAKQTHKIELYAQWNESGVQGSTATIHQRKMLLTFDEIGGLEGMARWLAVAGNYHTVTGTLVSHWYRPKMYVENQYMNVLVAAETLLRIRLGLGKRRFKLAPELTQLARETSGLFQDLVGDVDSWVKKIVQTRANRVVHPGLHDPGDGRRLQLLAESIYFLVVLVLFVECDVPQETLSTIVNHDRVSWLGRELKDLR